jgi:NAD(P)-dependent dehydrogenase (short-subunit alcohol dehydrogenase family)
MIATGISLVVGDHEALEAVGEELRLRGDEVVRLAGTSSTEHIEAATATISKGRQVRALVIGYADTPPDGSAVQALALVRAVTDGFVPGEGRIALLSGRDFLGWPGRTERAADLAGLVGLGRSLALELGPQGVNVNIACPPEELGPVVATEDPWEAPPPPLTGPVGVEDIAYTVAFMTHPESGHFTGQVLHVSGGLSVLSSLTA